MSRIVVQDGARRDLSQIRDWYDRQRSGLGDRFLDEAETKIKSLNESPESYPISESPYRFAKLKTFPHIVHFEVLGDTVIVFAVVHPARDPERWRQRRP